MDELKNQLQLVETELRTEQQLGAMADQAKITELQEKYQAILTQISQAEQRQREGAIEEKVHAEEIPFAVAGADFTDLPPQVRTLIETVVKVDRRRMLNEHTLELEQMEKELAEKVNLIHAQLDEQTEKATRDFEEINQVLNHIKDQYNEAAASVRSVNEVCVQLRLEKEDAEQKRDAAVAEMEQFRAMFKQADADRYRAEQEVERLQNLVDEYQRAKVYGERQSQQIIDVTPDESSSINAALDAVKKMYEKVEDYGSIMKVTKPDGSFELVKRQEVADEWEAADGQNSFRSEDHSTVTEGDTVPVAEEESVISVPTFQDEGQEPVDTGAPSQDGQVDAETIEARVAALELVVFGQAKAAA